MIISKTTAVLVLLIFAYGCAVGPDYEVPDDNFPDRFSVSEELKLEQKQLEQKLLNWWEGYEDPQLVDFINSAIENNQQLASAKANVERSRALLQGARNELLPAGTATGSISRSRRSALTEEAISAGSFLGPLRSNLYGSSLGASWELDIFGGKRRSVEAAISDLEAVEADTIATRLLVTAEVADAYFSHSAAQLVLNVLQKDVTAFEETYDLTKSRFDAGLDSEFDVLQAKAQVDRSKSQIPSARRDVAIQKNRLAVLVGTTPEELVIEYSTADTLYTIPSLSFASLSPQVLKRRPDIIAAERRLSASNARIGVQVAEYFPKFTLNGSIGLAANDTSNFFEADASTWSLGPSFSWRILDFGRIDAAINAAKADNRRALSDYKQVILESVQESENAFVEFLESKNRVDATQSAEESQRVAFELASLRYSEGLEEFLPVLDSQRQLNSARIDVIRSKESQMLSSVSLYRALGGGWSSEELEADAELGESSE